MEPLADFLNCMKLLVKVGTKITGRTTVVFLLYSIFPVETCFPSVSDLYPVVICSQDVPINFFSLKSVH